MRAPTALTLTWIASLGCSAPTPSTADAGSAPDAVEVDAGAAPCRQAPGPYAPWSTRCGHLVDREGRTVVVHGINARVEGVFDVTLDGGRVPLQPIPRFGVDDARRMRAMGFNLLRLPMQWSGVEPTERGGFDAAYLDRVAAAVEAARAGGLKVLLDLHQDAYSKEIGEDGAPLWAIVPPPDTLLQGPLTDLAARRGSAQVLRAFATFFGDGGEGERLRGRFAAMAAHVARRFAGDDTVIGYEVFNEPVAADRLVARLNEQVARAMREADPRHLIAFEPDATFRLVMNRSMRPSAPFPVGGGVYAPHTYPLAFTATESQRREFTVDTLRPAVESAREEAELWGVPLLITEWGYDPQGTRAADYHRAMQDLHAEFQAGAMYWVWKEQSQDRWGLHDYDDQGARFIERAAARRLLARVRPEAIAGDPVAWRWDASARRFELRVRGRAEVTAPHRIYIPAPEDFTADFELRCDGSPRAVTRDPETGVIEATCHGPGEHLVVVQPR